MAITMYDLERRVKAEGRIRNTTGKIFDEMRSTVTSGADYVEGILEANDYWVFVGSGRGPGGMPPVDRIQQWIDRAGLTISAWAVSRKIANEGTRAWREKKPNVFLTAIEAWEDGPVFGDLEQAGIRDMERASIDVLVKNLKT